MDVQCFSFGRFVLIPARQALLRGGAPVRIGTRALEILSVLVQRPGAVIDKRELMSMVWTDTFVDDSNLKVHIAALRKALDEECSESSCIATVIGRGYRFVEPVIDCAMSRGIDQGEQLNCSSNPSERLYGREDALHRLAMQVQRNRVVTIVGSAGVGKTAVAIAVAERLRLQFQHGTRLVDMNALGDPSHVPSAVAAALGITSDTSSLPEQLTRRLRSAEMLIILDTCECAVDASAAFVEFVHSTCPRVHILATSREILRVSGEQVFRLPALDTPPRGAKLTVAELKRYPAVQLFLDRATENSEDREVPATEATSIADLCAELDGIPLAIELAARRVRELGFAGLPPVLTDNFFSLNHGERNCPPRHRTLRAAIQWSLAPLPDKERLVLRRLAKIDGCFDLDEGIVASSDSVISRAEAAACIANLVSKSLVERKGYGRVIFRLLNSVRYCSSQKLAACAQQAGRLGRDGVPGLAFNELEGEERSLLFADVKPAYVMSVENSLTCSLRTQDAHAARAVRM
jgi:predicted ATPase